MDEIVAIARKHNLYLIEDAAQGIMSKYNGRPLGSIGDLGCLSFHETKNIISGEGGALLINNDSLIERAEIIRQKGTDRNKFFRGEVDKYSWQDAGSSFLPGEIISAFLWAQLEQAKTIAHERLELWNFYNNFFSNANLNGITLAADSPINCEINGHIYYILLDDHFFRDAFIKKMQANGVHCTFHYVPLHNSNAGKKFGRAGSSLNITENIANRLVRLPMWLGVDRSQVIESTIAAISSINLKRLS